MENFERSFEQRGRECSTRNRRVRSPEDGPGAHLMRGEEHEIVPCEDLGTGLIVMGSRGRGG